MTCPHEYVIVLRSYRVRCSHVVERATGRIESDERGHDWVAIGEQPKTAICQQCGKRVPNPLRRKESQ